MRRGEYVSVPHEVHDNDVGSPCSPSLGLRVVAASHGTTTALGIQIIGNPKKVLV